jgi:phage gp37-like protein
MDFEQTEDAIIPALTAGMVDSITGLAYLGQPPETYGGQLQGEIERLPINFPAVFVVFEGGPLSWVDGKNFKEDDTFTVLCCSSDVRGTGPLRKDATSGCYRMIKDVLKTLSGKNLGIDIYPLQPVSIYPVMITNTVAVYGVKFKTWFDSTYG